MLPSNPSACNFACLFSSKRHPSLPKRRRRARRRVRAIEWAPTTDACEAKMPQSCPSLTYTSSPAPLQHGSAHGVDRGYPLRLHLRGLRSGHWLQVSCNSRALTGFTRYILLLGARVVRILAAIRARGRVLSYRHHEGCVAVLDCRFPPPSWSTFRTCSPRCMC